MHHGKLKDTAIVVPAQEVWAAEGLVSLIEREAAKLGLVGVTPTVSVSVSFEHNPDDGSLERLKNALARKHVIFETHNQI